MKIMTFNVRIDVPVDKQNQWDYRKKAVVQYIKNENPDFVGFQEPTFHMIEFLSEELKEYKRIGISRDSSGESTPIFYKFREFQLLEEKTVWLTDTPLVPSKDLESFFPRIATYGIFRHNESKPFVLCNTHLDYASEMIQEKQMKVLVSLLETFSLRTVILGDFNATSEKNVHLFLKNQMYNHTYNSSQLQQATFHNFQGTLLGNPIDYIYLSKGWELKSCIIDHLTLEPTMLSDHYPVICYVE
jgi:endonuclease/exonuclease/phosphatase family metal-dependent hydrolase